MKNTGRVMVEQQGLMIRFLPTDTADDLIFTSTDKIK